MITEWFLSLFQVVVDWFAGLFPTDDPPAFIGGVTGFLHTIVDGAAGLGAWVPWAYLGLVGGILLTLWLATVSVKGIRWLWGLTPFSGGS